MPTGTSGYLKPKKQTTKELDAATDTTTPAVPNPTPPPKPDKSLTGIIRKFLEK